MQSQAKTTAPGGLEATRITVEEVLMRLDRGEPLTFLDSRRAEDWNASDETIAGAIRIEPGPVEGQAGRLPRDKAVVTFCACPHEASSARVAEELIALGFPDVHPLHGGFEAWKRAGGRLEPIHHEPVARATDPQKPGEPAAPDGGSPSGPAPSSEPRFHQTREAEPAPPDDDGRQHGDHGAL
jgi:rhodanese-related sulfurtransferase